MEKIKVILQLIRMEEGKNNYCTWYLESWGPMQNLKVNVTGEETNWGRGKK